MEESSENKPTTPPPPPSSSSVADIAVLEKAKPIVGDSAVEWIDYAVQQAVIAQKTVVETLESTISVTKARLDQIKSTGTAHLHMTIVSCFQLLKFVYFLLVLIAYTILIITHANFYIAMKFV